MRYEWGTTSIMETTFEGDEDDVSAYPLFTLQSYQPYDGKEDSILWGELFALICAMRNRAKQPKIENEKDMDEDLLDNEEEIGKYELEFHEAKNFSTVLLSYVGPK